MHVRIQCYLLLLDKAKKEKKRKLKIETNDLRISIYENILNSIQR